MNNRLEKIQKKTYDRIVAFFSELKGIYGDECNVEEDIMCSEERYKVDKKFNWFEDYFIFYVKNKTLPNMKVWDFYDKRFSLTFEDFQKNDDMFADMWHDHLKAMLGCIVPFLKGDLVLNNYTKQIAELIVKHLALLYDNEGGDE